MDEPIPSTHTLGCELRVVDRAGNLMTIELDLSNQGTPSEPIEGVAFLEVVSDDNSVGGVGYASAERCEDERELDAHLLVALWKRMECAGARQCSQGHD